MTLGTFLDRIGTSALIRRILLTILIVSLAIGASAFYVVLRQRALDTASREARLLLATAASVSDFTDSAVAPLIDKLPPDRFYREAVPFFTVDAVFERLRKRFPAYTLRQSALNPTNPNDRPTPHEVELTRRFRDDPALKELQGLRQDGERTLFYVATPVRIDNPQCLACHSTPDRAPPAMVKDYGSSNGFGWKLGDTIGILELSVPVTSELRGTTELAVTVAGGLFLVFLVTYLALTTTLRTALVVPLRRLAHSADAASRGSGEPIDLPTGGTNEVRRLADAIKRLEISLRKALHLAASAPQPPRDPG